MYAISPVEGILLVRTPRIDHVVRMEVVLVVVVVQNGFLPAGGQRRRMIAAGMSAIIVQVVEVILDVLVVFVMRGATS